MNYDTVVLDGEFTLIIDGVAEAQLEVVADGEFGAFTKVVGGDAYLGPYVVTPRAYHETVLQTEDKTMTDNVTVLRVPYWETSNLFDGQTVYIAEE